MKRRDALKLMVGAAALPFAGCSQVDDGSAAQKPDSAGNQIFKGVPDGQSIAVIIRQEGVDGRALVEDVHYISACETNVDKRLEEIKTSWVEHGFTQPVEGVSQFFVGTDVPERFAMVLHSQPFHAETYDAAMQKFMEYTPWQIKNAFEEFPGQCTYASVGMDSSVA